VVEVDQRFRFRKLSLTGVLMLDCEVAGRGGTDEGSRKPSASRSGR
jgi:hypothetical protein